MVSEIDKPINENRISPHTMNALARKNEFKSAHCYKLIMYYFYYRLLRDNVYRQG